MTDAPDPFTAPDADLTDFPFTPIFRSRLFGSRFHARVTDAEWRAGVTLWLKSWDQIPAGSLPDDDVDLCRLAELGRDMKQWKKVREGALHGWVKCSDGLLYHATVAEGVNEAWERKRKQSKKGKNGAEARWRKHAEAMQQASEAPATGMQKDATGIAKGNATGMPQAMPGDSNRYRQGQGQRESKNHPSDGAAGPLDAKTVLWREGLASLRLLSGQQEGPARKLLGKLVDHAGGDHERLLGLLRRAEAKQPDDPISWLIAAASSRGSAELFPMAEKPAATGSNPTARRFAPLSGGF